jgi:DNA-binding transcriptional LysR family regulator
MDEISELRLFIKMVEGGGLSAAARLVGSSPAAMSRALVALESRLGARLVQRTSRRFDLTDEGRQFYDRGARIIQELDEAEAEVSVAASSPRGQIRLVAPVGFGKLVIAPLIAKFAEQHKKITFQLILSDLGFSLDDPSADIVLTTRLPGDGNIIAKRIHSDRRIVCASQRYLLLHGRPETPQDLSHHNCIRLVRGQYLFDTWRFQCQGKQQEVKVGGRMSASSTDVLRDWVIAGHGIGLLAMWDILDAVQDGRLEECLSNYWCDQIDLYAVYPCRQYLPSRIRMFLGFLSNHLSGEVPGAK